MLRFCPVQNVFGWHAHILWQLSPNSARIIEPWEFQAVQSYKSASTVSHVKQSKENESMTYNGWYTKTTSLLWALACRIIFIWNLCISKVRGQQHIQNKTSPLSNLYPLFLSMTQHESLPLSFLAIWPNFKHIPLKRVKTLNGTLSQDGPACTWDRLTVCRCAASPWNSDVSAGLRLHNKDIPETNQKRC